MEPLTSKLYYRETHAHAGSYIDPLEELEENIFMTGFLVPSDMWDELKHEGLVPNQTPILRGSS